MDLRRLTDDYAVAPQIEPADMAEAAAAGFRTVICNRPDAEVPPELNSEAMRAAAEAAGLAFVYNPVDHTGLGPDTLETQAEAAATGPALAYCRSGTRSTVVWALSQAGRVDPDALIDAAARGGYDIAGLRPRLDGAG